MKKEPMRLNSKKDTLSIDIYGTVRRNIPAFLCGWWLGFIPTWKLVHWIEVTFSEEQIRFSVEMESSDMLPTLLTLTGDMPRMFQFSTVPIEDALDPRPGENVLITVGLSKGVWSVKDLRSNPKVSPKEAHPLHRHVTA
jgi:hypothetical protein